MTLVGPSHEMQHPKPKGNTYIQHKKRSSVIELVKCYTETSVLLSPIALPSPVSTLLRHPSQLNRHHQRTASHKRKHGKESHPIRQSKINISRCDHKTTSQQSTNRLKPRMPTPFNIKFFSQKSKTREKKCPRLEIMLMTRQCGMEDNTAYPEAEDCETFEGAVYLCVLTVYFSVLYPEYAVQVTSIWIQISR